MTAADFVPLTSLPDLRTGDLLLLKMRGGSPGPYPLFMIGTDRATWCHDDERRADKEGFMLESWQHGCELARLRGVERADLADDRWPETERRLRAAADAAPVAPVAPKVGDVLTAERAAGLADAPKPEPAKPAVKVGDEVREWAQIPAGAVVEDDCGDPPDCTPEQACALVEVAEGKPAQPAPTPAVGDRVPQTEDAWRALPPNTLVKVGDASHVLTAEHPSGWHGLVWCSADVGMRHPCLGVPGALATILALGIERTNAAVVAAIAGKSAAAPEAKLAPLKPGDRVADRWAELPPGSVVDTRDGSSVPLTVKREDGEWAAWYGINDGPLPITSDWTDDSGCKPDDCEWDEEYSNAVLVGRVTVGATGEDFVHWLAGFGYAPAVDRMREIDATKQPAREFKVGDEVTAEEAARLPVGAFIFDPARDSCGVLRCEDGWRSFHPACNGGDVAGQFLSLDEPLAPHGTLPRDGKIAALLDPADLASRRSAVTALARAGHQPAVDRLAAERPAAPPLKVGDLLTAEQIDALPVGAVVCEAGNWLRKCKNDHLISISSHPDDFQGPPHEREGWWRGCNFVPSTTLVGLDAPLFGDDLRAWCAARGFKPAIRAERELTALAAGPASPALDGEAAPVDDGDMASTQSTITLPNGISITQKASESDSDFAQRAAGIQHALATQNRTETAPAAQQPRGSVLDTLLSWGKAAAGDGARALINQRALAAVDAGRVAGAQALAAGAEALLGESAAVAVLRTAQHPAAPAIVDGLVSLGAAMMGADNLSRLTRARLVERVVSRGGEALVESGVGVVVTQVKRTIHAIGAAAAAAELPEQATPAEDATPAT